MMRAVERLAALAVVTCIVSLVSWCTVAAGIAGSHVWCLLDSDPDYQNPPFGDHIVVVDSSGAAIHTWAGFNTCQTIGGGRPILVFPDGQSAIVVENVSGTVSRCPLSTSGTPLWQKDLFGRSVDLSASGLLYLLTSEDGLIWGTSLLILNPRSGATLREVGVGGIDLVVDDAHAAVWIVGADIRNLTLDLRPRFKLDPVVYAAISVDYASDGSVWVAERSHSQVEGSRNRVIHIGQRGQILQSIELSGSPQSLSVDRRNNSVWVGGTYGLLHFSASGAQLLSLPGDYFAVRVVQRNGTVWGILVGGVLKLLTPDGRTIAETSALGALQCWIAVPWTGGASRREARSAPLDDR